MVWLGYNRRNITRNSTISLGQVVSTRLPSLLAFTNVGARVGGTLGEGAGVFVVGLVGP